MTSSAPTSSGFGELAELIQARRERVARLVNTEVVDLYWVLGRHISAKIKAEAWGRGTVNGLAEYLGTQAQGLRGFSASNLWRMRQFHETWEASPSQLATLLRELPWSSHLDLLGKCKTYSCSTAANPPPSSPSTRHDCPTKTCCGPSCTNSSSWNSNACRKATPMKTTDDRAFESHVEEILRK